MKKLAFATGLLCVGYALSSTAPVRAAVSAKRAAAPASQQDSAPTRALLDKYCVKCHNQRGKAGGLTLDDADVQNIGKSAETWEKVLRKLRTNRMPPRGN